MPNFLLINWAQKVGHKVGHSHRKTIARRAPFKFEGKPVVTMGKVSDRWASAKAQRRAPQVSDKEAMTFEAIEAELDAIMAKVSESIRESSTSEGLKKLALLKELELDAAAGAQEEELLAELAAAKAFAEGEEGDSPKYLHTRTRAAGSASRRRPCSAASRC